MVGSAQGPEAEARIEGTPTTAFGKYQLFASLGRGGMADVFLSVARGQMGFNKLAVVKRLRQALAEEAAFRNMFLDEARLAARLNHPNIVHTYEVGEQNGVYFIAMEYLEGQSLNKVLKEALRRNEPMETEVCVRIVADALAGLGHAHELRDYDGRPLQIIHRDVSPHNIFVTYDGHTKLVDFGIAKAALSSTETEVGVLKGKVAYMSPEQAVGGRIDARSDLFAMGIVLWELLARQRLMTGESAANTLHKLMNEPIPRVSQAVPGIDAQLDALVERALQKDPQLRFQSAAEMRGALEAWLSVQPRPSRQDDVGRRMQHLFASVREEVQRQVQRHMAAITQATSTGELQALTVESLRRMELSGANVSGQLLRLGQGGSGSGSGVVPAYGAMHSHASQYPSLRSGSSMTPPPPAKSNAVLIVCMIGFFVLAAVSIVVWGLRNKRAQDDALARGDDLASTLASGQPAGPMGTGPTQVGDPAAAATSPQPPDSASASVTPATSASAPSPTPTGRASATGRNVAVRPAPQPQQHAPTAQPQPPAEEKEPGFLTLQVYPWAKVSEGGRTLCTTPCVKVKMAPGAHTLTLENSDQGLKTTTVVVIKSGETTTQNLGLK
jgi:serine/threonine-protein kinase